MSAFDRKPSLPLALRRSRERDDQRAAAVSERVRHARAKTARERRSRQRRRQMIKRRLATVTASLRVLLALLTFGRLGRAEQ
jgi:hypothetical protein